jgi:hypothetical protein
MLNFRSLMAVMDSESGEKGTGAEDEKPQHIENVGSQATKQADDEAPNNQTRSRGDSGESSSSAPPPIYVEHETDAGMDDSILTQRPNKAEPADNSDPDAIAPVVEVAPQHNEYDKKHYGDISILDNSPRQATQ